ncbi:MAG TPA: hypothetical protein VL371_12705 [Gemmataceae bacterium]|nr:hypothetical protein [Gemmataceae bacterium]
MTRYQIGFLAILFLSGCGDNSGVGPTFPVTGTITINGQPLIAQTAMVLFKPDASRGNLGHFDPAGALDGQGHYVLSTAGKTGAPPGWYKVVVTATATDVSVPPGKRRDHPHPKSLVAAKYGQAATTTLSVEVVESPAAGAYDLKLTQ